jgi:hypothetical protein
VQRVRHPYFSRCLHSFVPLGRKITQFVVVKLLFFHFILLPVRLFPSRHLQVQRKLTYVRTKQRKALTRNTTLITGQHAHCTAQHSCSTHTYTHTHTHCLHTHKTYKDTHCLNTHYIYNATHYIAIQEWSMCSEIRAKQEWSIVS